MSGLTNAEFRALRKRYLDAAYRLYLALFGGFVALVLIELLTHGRTRDILLLLSLLYPIAFWAVCLRVWWTISRPYKAERARRGLPRFGRIGRWDEFFAQEDRSHPVSDEQLARRLAKERDGKKRKKDTG